MLPISQVRPFSKSITMVFLNNPSMFHGLQLHKLILRLSFAIVAQLSTSRLFTPALMTLELYESW